MPSFPVDKITVADERVPVMDRAGDSFQAALLAALAGSPCRSASPHC